MLRPFRRGQYRITRDYVNRNAARPPRRIPPRRLPFAPAEKSLAAAGIITLPPANDHSRSRATNPSDDCGAPPGKPVAPFSKPVGRNPEREPQARAGDRVEGSNGIPSRSSPGDEQESNRTVENRFENAAAFQSKDARMLIEKLAGSFLNTDFPNSCAVKVSPWTLFANLKVILHSLNAGYLPCDFQRSLPRV